MVTEVIDGVAATLERTFGSEYEIHRDLPKTTPSNPYFLVLAVSPSMQQTMGRRYQAVIPLEIRYISMTEENRNAELQRVGDQLFDALEYIQVNDILLRGTEMHYELKDDNLHFFLKYTLSLYRPVDNTSPMEQLKLKEGVK